MYAIRKMCQCPFRKKSEGELYSLFLMVAPMDGLYQMHKYLKPPNECDSDMLTAIDVK